MQLQPLAQYLLAENKSVLLLDACCLLDMIRGPSRGRMADFEAALAMATALDQGNLPFQIALPSPVPGEAQAHVSDARGVVTTHLQQHDATKRSGAFIRRSARLLHCQRCCLSIPTPMKIFWKPFTGKSSTSVMFSMMILCFSNAPGDASRRGGNLPGAVQTSSSTTAEF